MATFWTILGKMGNFLFYHLVTLCLTFFTSKWPLFLYFRLSLLLTVSKFRSESAHGWIWSGSSGCWKWSLCQLCQRTQVRIMSSAILPNIYLLVSVKKKQKEAKNILFKVQIEFCSTNSGIAFFGRPLIYRKACWPKKNDGWPNFYFSKNNTFCME